MKALATTMMLLMFTFSGCAASTGVQRFSESKSAFNQGPTLATHSYPDKDIYRVYQQGATGFVSINSVRETAERRALEYCERQGKGMVLLGDKSSQPPYILGNFPRVEIVFACIDKPLAQSNSTATSRYQDLAALKKLLDEGGLTHEEYEREKARILSSP